MSENKIETQKTSEVGIHLEGSSSTHSSAASEKYKIDPSKCSPILKKFLAEHDDFSEEDSLEDSLEDSSEDSEEDSTEDSEEDSLKDSDDIDDYNDWVKVSDDNSSENWIHFEEDSEKDSEEDSEEDSDGNNIDDNNDDWDNVSDDNSSEDGVHFLEETLDSQNSKVKNVSFSEPLITGIKLDDPDMTDELRAYRVDDWAQRRADQDR